MNFKKIENLSAILMVVSFFMPWLCMEAQLVLGKVASIGGANLLILC